MRRRYVRFVDGLRVWDKLLKQWTVVHGHLPHDAFAPEGRFSKTAPAIYQHYSGPPPDAPQCVKCYWDWVGPRTMRCRRCGYVRISDR